MTLSRGPYSELDKMSLFQDLKLKRRKVDSRCSSDGESIAETSTSSPDLLQPVSPKMCDQQPAHLGLPQKGRLMEISEDGLQKDPPDALTSSPTSPSSVDEEQEQVCSTASGIQTSANDGGSNSAGINENVDLQITSNYHANCLNGNELKDRNACRGQEEGDILTSYESDGSNLAATDTLLSKPSTKPTINRYDNATVLNTINLKDDAYESSNIVSPDCSPDVFTEEHTDGINGGQSSASNLSAASVIRSVADEQRPRSVNPPINFTTTSTSTKEQRNSSSICDNVLDNSNYVRLDSAPSIKIHTGHNTNNIRCAVPTTTTTCHIDSGASSKTTNAILIKSIESLHQQYDEESVGVENDIDCTKAQNGVAASGTAINSCTDNVRTLFSSDQTQHHATVLVTPPLSRMKNNNLSNPQGNSTGNTATAAAAVAAAATTLVTLGMRKQQSLPPLSTKLTESPCLSTLSSSTSASTSSIFSSCSSIPNSIIVSSDQNFFYNDSNKNTGISNRNQRDGNEMNDDHKSRQNIISPLRIDSSTFSDTTTTINTATNTTASEESSLSLSFHPQKSFTEVGGLPSKIISSQVIACAGNISSAVPNNSSQQQHVIITQQQMLQAMHQQIRIKKERQQKHLIVQNNHRTVHTSFSEVHNAQQLIIKRERSASSGLKSPNSSGSVALSHAAIIRQSASPGPMGNVNQMGPMQPPISPHQSISYRHPNSPVPMGSSCGTQKPQVIVKREHASSIHQQQFHLQHQPPSIGRTINVGALSPAGNFTTNNLPTTTSSFASTVGCLSMRNPIRDTALLFRVKNETNALLSQQPKQQQQPSVSCHRN